MLVYDRQLDTAIQHHAKLEKIFTLMDSTLNNKPSYLTEAWLPDEVELLDDKGVGLSKDLCFGFDEGSGSVCVWYCTLMSRLVPLGVYSLCNV